MKYFILILALSTLRIFSQSIDSPLDIITSNIQYNPSQPYVSSVNLTGNFNELIIPVGFPDRADTLGFPQITTNNDYPLLGQFPDGTLLKDYVHMNGDAIPVDEWFEPAFNHYFNTESGGLYNVNFQFIKRPDGKRYLTTHGLDYFIAHNLDSHNKPTAVNVISNRFSDIVNEVAQNMYADNPNIFDNVDIVHFTFEGRSKTEFYDGAGGTVRYSINLTAPDGHVLYQNKPTTLQLSAAAIPHEYLHIIGAVSGYPSGFDGFPDRGVGISQGENHYNILWTYDMMDHDAPLNSLHSLYGLPPILLHDKIFLGWIRTEEILTVNSSNINLIDFSNIKLADVNYPLTTQAIENGYRRVIKVMIHENYNGYQDEYFLIEFHNASEFDKNFENLDEYLTGSYNKGILTWHIKERTNLITTSDGMDNLIDLLVAVPYNGWYGNPVPNDDFPRNYSRPLNWNGNYANEFDYLDDLQMDWVSTTRIPKNHYQYRYLPDGGRHIWETTVTPAVNDFGWDPTNQNRFMRNQSLRSDFFTDQSIKDHISNSITDVTRPSTKDWGGYYSGSTFHNPVKTHIAITGITRHTGYMSLKVYYNYWTEDITANTTFSGNVFIGKNIAVSPGATLNIQPGTKLTFLNGAYLNVNGTLISNGTTNNKVTFDFISPNSTTQNGIRIYTGATLNVSNTIIRHAWYGIYCNYTYTSPISNWEIDSCNTGIYFSNTPIGISNNYIHDNSMGIALYNSSPTLTLNKIANNSNYGLSSSGSTAIPKFGNGSTQGKNKITGNGVGVCAFSNSLPMLGNNSPLNGGYNTFGENTSYNVYAITSGVLFAINNYWGNVPPALPVSSKIWISNGVILYSPYLSSDPTGLSKVAPPAENAELVLLKKAMVLIEQNDLLAAREICSDILDNYSDSYAAFNALSLLTQTYDSNEKETTKLKFKTLFNKGKKKLNAVAGLILSELDKENKRKNIDEVISKYKGDAIIEDALLAKFLYCYNDIQDKENARLVSNELDKLFPNSVSNIVAHQHLGDKDYLQKEYSFAKTNQEQKQNNVSIPLPEEYNLFANYPNPFNPVTVIKYALPFASNVNITVYNTLGQIVKEYFEGTKEAGYYSVNFIGENLSSGVYLYSINAVSANGKQNFNATKKMILMK